MFKLKKSEANIGTNLIEDYINKYFKEKGETITSISFGNNRESVYCNIETKKDNNTNTWILEDEDIILIGVDILKNNKVDYIEDSISTFMKHVDGDSRELMDYGSFEFCGLKYLNKIN
ncbi:hypothetical protein HOK00_04265 [bacterium]|nr:hypothetical protein [bacterium]